MVHAITIGCAGAIAMNLTVCKKQVEKQWRQQVVMIVGHKFIPLCETTSIVDLFIWDPPGHSTGKEFLIQC